MTGRRGWGGAPLAAAWLGCVALTQACETRVINTSNPETKARSGSASSSGGSSRAPSQDGAGAGAAGRAGTGGSASAGRGGSAGRAGAGSAGRAAAAGGGGAGRGIAAGSGATAGTFEVSAGSDAAGRGSAGGEAAGAGGDAMGSSGAGGEAGTDAGPVLPTGEYTYLSDTDRGQGIQVSPDHLSAEWLGLGTYGIRSTRSIAPGSGVYYAEIHAELDDFQIGVATANAPLDRGAGATADGFGLNVLGTFMSQGQMDGFQTLSGNYGFVVDYRGAFPRVHVISGKKGEAAKLLRTQALDSISTPLFLHLCGMRRIAGPQASINAGNDTVNRPFTFDPATVLRAAGLPDVASALVLGWGATHSAAFNQPPMLTVPASLTLTINEGESATLTASASDVEEGAISARINWDVLSMGNGPERVHGSGGSFTFTPNAIGKHPVRVSVSDQLGKEVSTTVVVTVRGSVPQASDVRLTPEPGLSGAGIVVSSDGFKAHWSVDSKNGVRANQALYGGFWYVEGHRLVEPSNQAIGLVIGHVTLNPYPFDVTPPSCSVNTYQPGVYHDLITVHEFGNGPDVAYYGLAVDYRKDTPIVYVIMNGTVASKLELDDVTVPVYPMLYGNLNTSGAAWDMEINFGGAPFHEDPKAALSAAGIDASALQLCWGSANAACKH